MARPLHLVRRLLGAAAIAGAVTACAVNPVTGAQDVVLLTEQQEIALGRQNDPQIRQQYGVYDDAKLQAYVQRVGERLAQKSHRPGLRYTFTVLDSDEVNAFALPGGYVYITRGILAYLNSEAELAAVLGHEIGHVTARHSVRQYTAAMAANLGVEIAKVFVPELGNQLGQELLNAIGGALLSGYGRDHELEADRLGAEYLARGGFDPDALIGVIGVLKNQEEFEKKRAEVEGREARVYHGVFASHPSADQRLQQAVGEAQRFKTAAATRVARAEYLRLLDGTVFGESPREGVRRGSSFYHRDLNFAVDFPEGWKLANTPKSVVATSPEKNALIDLRALDLDQRLSPEELLRTRLRLGELKQEGALEGASLPAHTAVAHIGTPFGSRDTRVSVLYHGAKAFTLFGTAREPEDFGRLDPQFLASAKSLRPLNAQEKRLAAGLRLKVRKAGGETFAALGRKAPINQYGEAILRLINAKFPEGEPKAGELIKIIE